MSVNLMQQMSPTGSIYFYMLPTIKCAYHEQINKMNSLLNSYLEMQHMYSVLYHFHFFKMNCWLEYIKWTLDHLESPIIAEHA